MTPLPDAIEYVKQITPYDPGKRLEDVSKEIGIKLERLMMLNANENPHGMPSSARAAVEAELAGANRYPDGGAFALREAIAAHYDIDPDEVICGNGSDEILSIVAGAFLEPGKRCVFSQYSFSVYALVAEARGATCVEVPVKEDFGYDLDQLLEEARKPATSVLFLTNPNNPTGLVLDRDALERVLREVPESVCVVLDEAYREFADQSHFEEVCEVIRRHPNVLVARTFSKAYGLAGMRIGYAMGSKELIELLNRLRAPYNANRLAQAAATAAIADNAFLEKTVAHNRRELENLYAELDHMKVRYLPTQTNFLMIEVPNGAAVVTRLRDAGIMVRSLKSYGLDNWIRVSIGKSEEMLCFMDVFRVAIRILRHGDKELI